MLFFIFFTSNINTMLSRFHKSISKMVIPLFLAYIIIARSYIRLVKVSVPGFTTAKSQFIILNFFSVSL